MSPEIEWAVMTASRSAAAILLWSWQAFALLGGVWVGLKLFRVRTPATRHNIWLIGLIAISMAPFWGGAAARLNLSSSFPAPRIEMLLWEAEPLKIADALSTPSVAINRTAGRGRSFSKFGAMAALFFLWFLIVAIRGARLVREWDRLRRLRNRATPVAPADLECPDLELRGAGLAVSTEIRSPFTIGVFRPAILVPADLAEWTSPEERRAILKHEQAHIDRRDTWINLLTNSLSVLFFFHPMIRYAIRRLEFEREIACDDRVVDQISEAANYAESLYKVAERCILKSGSPSGVDGLALLSARDILERRIEMILDQNRIRVVARQWRYIAISVLLIAGVAWLLAPAQSMKTGRAQTNVNNDDAPPPPPPPPLPPALSLSVVRGETPQSQNIQNPIPIHEMLHDLALASINRDVEFFTRALDDSYEEIGPNGEVLDKAAAIAEIQKPGYELKRFDFYNLRIYANPLGAFATFLGSAEVEVNGVESTIQYRYTVNFVRPDKEGQPTIAAMHISSVN